MPLVGRFFEAANHAPKKVTFLGVVATALGPVVADQLDLPQGFGLAVESVMPESPATQAGIKPSDILKQLNDQLLVDPNQLATLVRSFKEGDSVNFTIIRKGKELKVTASLAVRQLPALNFRDVLLGEHGAIEAPGVVPAPGGPGNVFHEAHPPVGPAPHIAPFPPQPPGAIAPSELHRLHKRALRQHHEQVRDHQQSSSPQGGDAAGEQGGSSASASASVTTPDPNERSTVVELNNATFLIKDDDGEVSVVSANGHKALIAKDKNGAQRFNGPINTEAERAAVPADLQRYLKMLDKQRHVLPPPPQPPLPPTPPAGSFPGPELRREALRFEAPETGNLEEPDPAASAAL